MHDISPGLWFWITLTSGVLRQISIDVSASRVDPWSEKWLRLLLNFFYVFLFRFWTIELFTGLAHIEELAID